MHFGRWGPAIEPTPCVSPCAQDWPPDAGAETACPSNGRSRSASPAAKFSFVPALNRTRSVTDARSFLETEPSATGRFPRSYTVSATGRLTAVEIVQGCLCYEKLI